MQYAWLEQLVKEGHVSERARDAIYRDCSGILKLSAAGVTQYDPRFEQFWDKHGKWITGKVNTVLALGATAAGASFLSSLSARKAMSKATASIASARKAVVTNPEFSAHREKAEARFDDLVRIAPTVAQNPDLSLRIIKEKIHSGFSSQDIQGLALIQATYTPNMPAQMKLTERAKTASAEKVGVTLATQIMMCKEAGISLKTMGRAAENALVLSTIPILGGLGVGAVKHVESVRDKKKLNERLTASFEQAMRMSDPDKDGLAENKETARQAFQVLAHFSPHVALEPNAAKAFMKKLVAWSGQGPQIEDIKNLSDIEKNYRSGSRGSSFFEGLASGSKALGLDQSLRASTGSLAKPMEFELANEAAADMGLPSTWRKGG